ncbi:hypothetical protein SO802_016534 [Lithocarpus litseifolius]|uniref:Uncharacterized protein n=1 Tax=Lithocarpus litseifolius TaxID=425828 RepID=A0AAW2CZB8_9ROSI
MGIQYKSKTSLLEVMESQARGKESTAAGQAKHPCLPIPHDPQLEPADKKRKQEQNGKEVLEEGRGVPPKENEPQRGAKVAKTSQTRSLSDGVSGDRGCDLHTRGKAEYVADAIKQALLLPDDMADLRTMKKHEVFLGLKRDLTMVVQATFRAEELVNISHRQMNDEEGRQVAAVEAFNMAEKKEKKLNAKLIKAEREKKSAEVAQEGAEKQAETQRKQLRQAEDELTAARELIKLLKNKLDQA